MIDESRAFVDDAGEIYFVGYLPDAAEKTEKSLRSGVTFSEGDAVFVFARSGELKFTVEIPRLGGRDALYPFIGREGNVCYLRPKERVIEVMEWRRGLSVAERASVQGKGTR